MELFLKVLPHLYGSIAVVAIAGYLPQIHRLYVSTTKCNDVSILTWLIWLSTWMISLAYGYFILYDWRFMMVAGINIFFHLCIIGMAVYKRYFCKKYF